MDVSIHRAHWDSDTGLAHESRDIVNFGASFELGAGGSGGVGNGVADTNTNRYQSYGAKTLMIPNADLDPVTI